jgi:non-specific serine/threonine protein kinase
MSLLIRTDASGAKVPRFAMLETIREYALEQLERSGEATTTRDAHAAYFLALAEQSEFERIDAGQRAWLDLLEAEHANLLAALDWLAERNDLDTALRLAVACSWFWSFRGHYTEGRTRLASLLARSDPEKHGRARAAAMYMLGSLTRSQGDGAQAIQLHEASVAAWRQLDDPFHLAYALSRQGVALMYAGDEQAVTILTECVGIARTLPDQRWLGGTLWELGRAQHYQGHLESAAEHLAGSLARARELRNPAGIAFSLWALGDLAWDQGDQAGSRTLLRQALPLLRDLGEAWSLLLCLERLAATGASHEQHWAARLLAAAESWRAAVGLPRPQVEETRYKSAIAAARAALGEDTFTAAWNAGSSFSPEQAIAVALDQPPT